MSIGKIVILALGMVILTSSVFVADQAFGQQNGVPVGGLPLPVDESALNGELAKQYSLWLIPSISAIGIAAFLIKRKL